MVGDDGFVVIVLFVVGLVDLICMIVVYGCVCNVIWLCKGFDFEISVLLYVIVVDVLKVLGCIDFVVGVLLGLSFVKEVV